MALAYGAAYPDGLGGIMLVGSGTFDVPSRRRLAELRNERLGESGRGMMARLAASGLSAADRMKREAGLLFKADSHDLAELGSPVTEFDPDGHDGSWDDMIGLQEGGTYPAAYAAVRSPVLMLHGDLDPHPGPMIRDSLRPHLPQLEYVELERCGHYPWLELRARDRFYEVAREWLLAKAAV